MSPLMILAPEGNRQ